MERNLLEIKREDRIQNQAIKDEKCSSDRRYLIQIEKLRTDENTNF